MKKCMLIPGNPAVAEYYQSWIEELTSANPNLDITYATSYVLFSKKLNYIEYDKALREYYAKIMLDLSSKSDDGTITLIAHSAGSYFALRLLELYPEKIDKVFIIFPYIGYSQYNLLNYVYIPYIIDKFFPLVEFVSKYKNIIMAYEKHITHISSEQLKANLRFGVRQCVYFIKTKFPTEVLESAKNKITFIYTDNDRWCPPVAVELLKNVSKPLKVSLPHGFIMNKEDRLKMVEVLEKDLA